jgi:hypothetical protein
MLVRRLTRESYTFLNAPISEFTTQMVWSQDGWMYDTAKNIRRQYFPIKGPITVMKMIEEPCGVCVIPAMQHSETVNVKIYSKSPRIWSESGPNYEDVFVEQSDHNTTSLLK